MDDLITRLRAMAPRPDDGGETRHNRALYVEAANLIETLLSSLSAARGEVERIDQFAKSYFEPWGSWKTAWWEGEVSDDVAFSDHNALKHIANMTTAFRAKTSENGHG